MRVCRRNGISIGSSVFAGLTGVPNTQTDEQTVSVSTGRQRLKTFLFQASFQVCHGYELGMGYGDGYGDRNSVSTAALCRSLTLSLIAGKLIIPYLQWILKRFLPRDAMHPRY